MNDSNCAYLFGCVIGFLSGAGFWFCIGRLSYTQCKKDLSNKDRLDKKEIGKPAPPQSKIIKE